MGGARLLGGRVSCGVGVGMSEGWDGSRTGRAGMPACPQASQHGEQQRGSTATCRTMQLKKETRPALHPASERPQRHPCPSGPRDGPLPPPLNLSRPSSCSTPLRTADTHPTRAAPASGARAASG